MSKKKELKNYIARVRRVVLTDYEIEATDEAEARKKMDEWDVGAETEVDQVDWEVKSIEEA